MANLESLTIPSELRPRDGRFGSGPSLVRPQQLAAIERSGVMGTSHRQPPVKNIVADIITGLRQLFEVPGDYPVVLGNGGSTAFWAVATTSLIERRSAHAVFGEFSGKFAAESARAPFLAEPAIFEAEPGQLAQVEAVADADVYAWAHQETSTGVISPVARPAGINPDALVLVDATSIAGAVQVDVTQTDAYYFAPQKAFGSDGGIWFALCSPRALERAARLTQDAPGGRWVPDILNLTIAATNSAKNQTLNTPALATLIMMREQVDWMVQNGGLPWAQKRCEASSQALYSWAEARDFATPFVERPEWRSPVVGTVDLIGVEANDVVAVLRNNGILDTFAYRKLGRNQIRIGMFPAVDPADVEALTASIDWVVERL